LKQKYSWLYFTLAGLNKKLILGFYKNADNLKGKLLKKKSEEFKGISIFKEDNHDLEFLIQISRCTSINIAIMPCLVMLNSLTYLHRLTVKCCSSKKGVKCGSSTTS
jgi:hypothetical protein